MKDSFVAWAYIVAWKLLRALPERVAYTLFNKGAIWLVKRNGKSVQRFRKNLSCVKPNLSESEMHTLVEKGLASYMRYWCDTFRFPNWSKERVISTVTVTREELLLNGIKSGRGVIVALPHAGNWDHAGAYFCLKGIHLVTVAERLKPERLFNEFLRYRQAMGMEVLALDSRSIVTLAQRLREGHLVALVADRDLSKSGIDVNFFGRKARMPAGPAVLAIKTEAIFLTAFVNYTERGIHITFDEIQVPVNGTQEEKVSELVQKSADNFADGIRCYPQDWHMLQRIWIDDDFKERN
ncbi:MAG: phosphatidylinositol mannoside acyltransferase [Actinobacteria bacterium]|nr:phosphatidylinositol mannoside acyltransferase [Actinomycetota bacterium]